MNVQPLHHVTDLTEIGHCVHQARVAVRAADPAGLLEAMGVLLNDDHWRHYIDPYDHQPYDWADFRVFVQKKLETTVDGLVGALSMSPSYQAQVIDLGIPPVGVHHPDIDNVNITTRNTGNAAPYGMRRLLRERPDLADLVERGELSVNAACVEAGFRKPMASIPVDSAASAINALRRRFTDAELRAALDVDGNRRRET